MNLWEKAPGQCEEIPGIVPYIPKEKKSRAAVLIFAGGGYWGRVEHEGKVYADFLNEHGITAFCVDYRVHPHIFPLALLDARRAVRFVRAHADEYGIDKDKIAVMGSSAGGHLAANVSTYRKELEFEDIDEIDKECPFPDAQILCYPVISCPAEQDFAHVDSYTTLLGGRDEALERDIDPCLNVSEDTPQAFIWHTANDNYVEVLNSYEYAIKLRRNNVPTEMHIFPDGEHGLGLAKTIPHVAQWSGLLINWFKNLGWLDK